LLLTFTYAQLPARDLGYLLHKSHGTAQSIDLPFGKAHAFCSPWRASPWARDSSTEAGSSPGWTIANTYLIIQQNYYPR